MQGQGHVQNPYGGLLVPFSETDNRTRDFDRLQLHQCAFMTGLSSVRVGGIRFLFDKDSQLHAETGGFLVFLGRARIGALSLAH